MVKQPSGFGWRQRFTEHPVAARVVPFLVFVGLTFFQGRWGAASPYWVYLLKTVIGAGMVVWVWPGLPELRWRFSGMAVAVGLGVFVVWVGLDGWYPSLDTLEKLWLHPLLAMVGLASPAPPVPPLAPEWNPALAFGEGSAAASAMVVVRMLGSTLVVPPLEEVFYRSFLYRYLIQPGFTSVPLGTWRWQPFLLTALVFGFSHREWLPGLLCGLAFQGLVCWKNRLGDALVAHAIANFLLGVWVVARGAWHFW